MSAAILGADITAFNPIKAFGSQLLFHADAITNPLTTFYTTSGLTTPSANPGDPVLAIKSAVGSLSATKAIASWTLRPNRIGSSPTAWGGFGLSDGTSGFAINGINITLASECTVCLFYQCPSIYSQDTINSVFSPTSINAAYQLQQNLSIDNLINAGTNQLNYIGESGPAGASIGHAGTMGLWQADVWVMHGSTCTLTRLSARVFEVSQATANFPASPCANVQILGLGGNANCHHEVARYSIINRALTNAEAVQMCTWMFGTVNPLPPANRPVVMYMGNSINAGTTVTMAQCFVGLTAQAFSPQAATTLNYSVSGEWTGSLTQGMMYHQQFNMKVFSGRNVVGDVFNFQDVGNDITFNGTAGNYTTYDATAYANLIAAMQLAQSLLPSSVAIVLETPGPRITLTGTLSNAQWETCRTNALNRMLAAFPNVVAGTNGLLFNGSIYGSNVYVWNAGGITGMVTPTDAAGANFTDGCHPSAAGHILKAAQWQPVLIALGTYTALTPPTCPNLQTWFTWQRGVTSDYNNGTPTGCIESVGGDQPAQWASQLPTVGAQIFGSFATGNIFVLANGRNTVQTNSGLGAVMKNTGALPIPFPCTMWAAGTILASLPNLGAIFVTNNSTAPGVSGLIAVTGNKLGYIWNLSATTYTFTGGPTLPAVGTRCLLAVVVQSTGATLYLQTASGQQSATQTTALAALSPTTSTAELGGCFGGIVNASHGFEQFGTVNGVLAGSDITALFNSLA